MNARLFQKFAHVEVDGLPKLAGRGDRAEDCAFDREQPVGIVAVNVVDCHAILTRCLESLCHSWGVFGANWTCARSRLMAKDFPRILSHYFLA